jgi:nucleoside recognition membrane protein YjiH
MVAMTGKKMKAADLALIAVLIGSNVLMMYSWRPVTGWPVIVQLLVAYGLITLVAVAIVSSMYQRAVEAARREGKDEARREP